MRMLLLTIATLAAAGTATASSVEIFASGTSENSIDRRSCADCPPPVITKKTGYIVPEVAVGTDRVEVKEINGEMKLVRTEAWLGGSPVVFITKASPQQVEAARAKAAPDLHLSAEAAKTAPQEAEAATTLSVIDDTATTGALGTQSLAGMAGITPKDSHSQEFDLQSFKLRLN